MANRGRPKGSKNIAKTGKLLKDGSTPFTLGTEKVASINKEATGEYSVTQTQSFFYSPELTSDSWVLPKSRQEILKWQEPLGSLVFTNSGLKQIEDIIPGDLVLSSNGKWQQVEDVCKKFYTDKDETGNEWTDIKVQGFPEFSLGAYHPITAIKRPQPFAGKDWRGKGIKAYVHLGHKIAKTVQEGLATIPKLNPSKYLDTIYTDQELGISDSIVHWVSAKKLEVGDFVVFPKFKNIEEKEHVYFLEGSEHGNTKQLPKSIVLDADLAYLLGWYVAEGNNNVGFIKITLALDEEDVANKLVKILQKLFPNVTSKWKFHSEANAIQVFAFSKYVAEFFEETCGHKAANKHIPEAVLNGSKDILFAFLDAYFHGDGSFKKSNRGISEMSVVTVSRTLAYQTMLALSKFDVLASFTRLDMKKRDYFCNGKKLNTQPYSYHLTIQGEMLNKLYSGMDTFEGRRVVKYLEDDKNFYLPVREVTTYNKDGWGYDLRTTDHTYVAPVLVSNCRIFFNLEPYVQQITVMHSLYPFSKFDMVVADPSVKKFYEEMSSNGDFNLFEFILQASLSREKFGEAICFGNMTQDDNSK